LVANSEFARDGELAIKNGSRGNLLVELNNMQKQTKTTYILLGLVILSVFVHNALYGFFKIEEPVSFILVFLFTLGFVLSVVQNTINYIRKGEPGDLWKLGWIGLFGLLGLVGSAGLYGFFGFFGFFGTRGWKKIKSNKNF